MEPQLRAPTPAAKLDEPKVVFESTIDGLFLRALAGRITPRCKERLRGAGLDLDRKLLPAYEFEKWMRVLRIAAEEVYPGERLDRAMFLLGERMVDGFFETLVGKALSALVRLIGPVKTLERTSRNFRAGNSYTVSKLTRIDATCYELWMNEVGDYPSFTEGIIHAGLRASGAKEVVVTQRGYDGHACTYLLRWS